MKLLGHGSFSTVCLASDAFTEEKVSPRIWLNLPPDAFLFKFQPIIVSEKLILTRHADLPALSVCILCFGSGRALSTEVLQVALKRIPDVLSSPEQAKRVLREVCILRRLKHPFLINLRDAFTRPSTCGKL